MTAHSSSRGHHPALGDGDCLPAALAPLRQVRPLGPQGGVTAVAGVDPGRVGQPVEDLGDDPGVQRVEPRRVLLRVPDAAGEQAATGAFAGRRWRCVALLATVVSSLTGVNGPDGARGKCSPVTWGGAQESAFWSCLGMAEHPAVPGRVFWGRLGCCCLQWALWPLLTLRSSGWSSTCAMPGCGCTASGCAGRTRLPRMRKSRPGSRRGCAGRVARRATGSASRRAGRRGCSPSMRSSARRLRTLRRSGPGEPSSGAWRWRSVRSPGSPGQASRHTRRPALRSGGHHPGRRLYPAGGGDRRYRAGPPRAIGGILGFRRLAHVVHAVSGSRLRGRGPTRRTSARGGQGSRAPRRWPARRAAGARSRGPGGRARRSARAAA
jgi:hypothetical protein